jgi:hypothetical protein
MSDARPRPIREFTEAMEQSCRCITLNSSELKSSPVSQQYKSADQRNTERHTSGEILPIDKETGGKQ